MQYLKKHRGVYIEMLLYVIVLYVITLYYLNIYMLLYIIYIIPCIIIVQHFNTYFNPYLINVCIKNSVLETRRTKV
jgi:hypothetical protein